MRWFRFLKNFVIYYIDYLKWRLIYKRKEEEVKEKLDDYQRKGYVIYATSPGVIYVGSHTDFRQHIDPYDRAWKINSSVAASLIVQDRSYGNSWELEIL